MLDTLPDEIILDAIAPFLTLSSLLNLSQANKHLRAVCSDNTLWRRRIREDFNVPDGVTARKDGWKELYGRLRRPDVYVWGASSNGRLGIRRDHPAFQTFHANYEGVNQPVRLPLDAGVGIVDLHASGYGFVGLDTAGGIWVWGTLDGNAFLSRSRPNWQTAGAVAPEPRHVVLPARARSVSCGRRHVLILDEEGSVWELTGWGKAWKREKASIFPSIAQLEAGWGHSAVLSSSGTIAVWWPSFEPLTEDERSSAKWTAALAGREPGETEIDVEFAVEAVQPYTLPPLIDSVSEPRHLGDQSTESSIKAVKIACGDGFVVALDDEGKVWTCWVGSSESEVGHRPGESATRFWELHTDFRHPLQAQSPQYHITHISAHFETFFAYSPGSIKDGFASSVVLKGSKTDLHRRENQGERGATPEIIQDLQGKGVIKIVVGDYHFGALTADGKLFTWGSYSSGALGLGQTAQVSHPTEVSFGSNDQADHFVFAAAASGWHTGALVLNLSKTAAETTREREEDRQAGKLAPTPRHLTLPTRPDTSRFRALDPPPSSRPIPGQADVAFPALTRGLPTPFFGGTPVAGPSAMAPGVVPGAFPPGDVRRRPGDLREVTLPVQPPGFNPLAWAQGRTGPGSQAGAAERPARVWRGQRTDGSGDGDGERRDNRRMA